jgi:hypothetical protein
MVESDDMVRFSYRIPAGHHNFPEAAAVQQLFSDVEADAFVCSRYNCHTRHHKL